MYDVRACVRMRVCVRVCMHGYVDVCACVCAWVRECIMCYIGSRYGVCFLICNVPSRPTTILASGCFRTQTNKLASMKISLNTEKTLSIIIAIEHSNEKNLKHVLHQHELRVHPKSLSCSMYNLFVPCTLCTYIYALMLTPKTLLC